MNADRSAKTQRITSWSEIDWTKIEEYVMKLQQQIFLAEVNRNIKKVKQLQRTLINSKANLLMSIEKICTNRISGSHWNDTKKLQLYNQLLTYNISKLKPSSLSDIRDLVFQNVIRAALEPQWEVHFEPNSYGSRPGRSIHDAIGSIFNKAGPKKKRRWIFVGSFTNDRNDISRKYILQCITDFPYQNVVSRWLDVGCINNIQQDMPQKILAPLLINIMLHGLEKLLNVKYSIGRYARQINNGPTMVRYKNNFAIFCSSENEARNMSVILSPYLQLRGIKLDTTKIVHIRDGFDFVDFNIRIYDADPNNPDQREKLLIKPSKDAIKRVVNSLRMIFKKYQGYPLRVLIEKTNPIVRGIAYYWRHVVSSLAYKYIDNYLDYKFYKHIKRLHPRKSWKWIKQNYYKKNHSQSTEIRDPKDCNVKRQYCRDTKIKRHILVAYNRSPFDPRLKEYWNKRQKQLFDLRNGEGRIKLARRQKYICPICLQSLCDDYALEINHILPAKYGGETKYRNLQLMHKSCYIKHHKSCKCEDDYRQYMKDQCNWYDSIWNNTD